MNARPNEKGEQEEQGNRCRRRKGGGRARD